MLTVDFIDIDIEYNIDINNIAIFDNPPRREFSGSTIASARTGASTLASSHLLAAGPAIFGLALLKFG